ncbi:hypothetical protein [Tenacibaculum larymnensis]|uniref:Uncharacterized protein n=1 Tax=Tenacibaculum larymnensis TaxID=2878201 RepID=A0A9X4EPW7_9FLAO|nr:hypothetical protein [Tenacibaculum larymnensis]MDE1206837.1 hypothetical protein [Tenacibaculum larymnensis]
MKKLTVSAWNDDKHNQRGNGYGIRVGVKGRDFFEEKISEINLSIENSSFFKVKITSGFWKDCPEFRDKRIGKWLIENNFTFWKKGMPPKFYLTVLGNNQFLLEKID